MFLVQENCSRSDNGLQVMRRSFQFEALKIEDVDDGKVYDDDRCVKGY